MTTSLHTCRLALLLTSLLLTLGCGSPAPAGNGFMKDYGRLKPSTVAPGALTYQSPSLGTRSFGGCAIDPVTIAYTSESQWQMADKQREAEVRQYLAAKLEQVKDRITPTTGAPQLKVRAAITDVDPAQMSGSFQSTVTPGAAAMGRGTLEVEMIEASTGEVMFAFIDRRDKVRPSGPQQVNEAKKQVDEAVARLMADFDAARGKR